MKDNVKANSKTQVTFFDFQESDCIGRAILVNGRYYTFVGISPSNKTIAFIKDANLKIHSMKLGKIISQLS